MDACCNFAAAAPSWSVDVPGPVDGSIVFLPLRVPSLGTAEVLLLTGLRYWHVECCVESHRRIIYGGVQLSNVPSQQVGPYMLVLG